MAFSKAIASIVVLHFLATCSGSEFSCEVSEATNGSCTRTENDCHEEHSVQLEKQQCESESSNLVPSNCPNYTEGQPVDNCPNDGDRPPAESIVRRVSADAYVVSISEYVLRVSWNSSDDAATDPYLQGYQVRLHAKSDGDTDSFPVAGCACKNRNETDPNETEHNFTLPYNKLDNRQLIISVTSYPTDGVARPPETTFDVPKNCHDPRFSYDPILCSPPRYGEPTNVILESTRTSNDTMSTKVSWEPPIFDDDIYPNHLDYPRPTTYYLYVDRLYAVWETAMFTVNNTEAVTIQLNITGVNFMQIRIEAYVKCSGDSIARERHRGCGVGSSNSFSIPPLPLPMATSTVPRSTAFISSDIPFQTNAPSPPSDSVPSVKISAIVISTVIACIVATAVVITMIIIYRRFSVNGSFSPDSEASSEISTPTTDCQKSMQLEWEHFPPMPLNLKPAPPSEYYTEDSIPTEPHKIPSTAHSLFLLFSPFSSDMEVKIILQRLYFPLSRYIRVTKPDDHTRAGGTLALWLSDNMTKASTVLCVCNATFREEWDRNKPASVEVSTLRELVAGALTHDRHFSKFAVVYLSQAARSYHIPELLLGSRHFLMTEIKEMVEFATETPKYMLPS